METTKGTAFTGDWEHKQLSEKFASFKLKTLTSQYQQGFQRFFTAVGGGFEPPRGR